MDRDGANLTASPAHAYPRAAVEEFLASATAEQERLRASIQAARDREHGARMAVETAAATSRVVRSTLHDLQRQLEDQRAVVEGQAAAIVQRAQGEATLILRNARARAREALQRSGYRPQPDLEIDLTDDSTSPVPDVEVSSPVLDPATLTPSPSEGNGNGNGNGSHELSANGGSGVVTKAEKTEGNGSRISTLSGLLRRTRARVAEPLPEEGPDEFIEFLRGALLDDEPLGPVDGAA